jgi:prepilin-type N-terminal cleavage/methylation domain-containing protein
MNTISPSSGSPRRKPSGCPLPVFGSPRRKPSGCPLPVSVSPRRKPRGCPLPVSGCPNSSRPLSSPRAFTLVELLVVIGIIGLLAAIITPVVMQSLTKARNAAIKAEIDMLHMAIMNYKNEYGSFPPCVDTDYTSSSYTTTGQAAKHITRLFPRCALANAVNQLNNASSADTSRTVRTDQDVLWLTYLYAPGSIPANKDLHLNPHNAIAAWLLGYTSDPTNPLISAGLSRQKLFDFDQSRLTGSFYSPSQKPNSPYLYINSAFYSSFPYAGGSSAIPGAMRQTYAGDATPFANLGNDWFNATTFQILCAGRDEQFGTDDDLSNFWPGTRREYLDSLKD